MRSTIVLSFLFLSLSGCKLQLGAKDLLAGSGAQGQTQSEGAKPGEPAAGSEGSSADGSGAEGEKGAPSAAKEPENPLAAVAVTRRFPQFKPEDSFNQAKIAEALALVTDDMIVHPLPFEPGNGLDHEYQPSPRSVEGGLSTVALDGCKADKGLPKYGTIVDKERSPAKLAVAVCSPTKSGVLVEGTPGVIWSVGEKDKPVIFVTLDGGRYQSRRDKLTAGKPAVASWPAPFHHQYLVARDIEALSKAGVLPMTTWTDMDSADDAWIACNNKVWEKADKEYTANDASATDWRTKEARGKQITEKYANLVDSQCGVHLKKYDVAALTAHESIAKARAATYEIAKTKLGK